MHEGEIDEKNIRRRVYDALNVLEACGAISKSAKTISWVDWPKVPFGAVRLGEKGGIFSAGFPQRN